jgi:hypothetical protein
MINEDWFAVPSEKVRGKHEREQGQHKNEDQQQGNEEHRIHRPRRAAGASGSKTFRSSGRLVGIIVVHWLGFGLQFRRNTIINQVFLPIK